MQLGHHFILADGGTCSTSAREPYPDLLPSDFMETAELSCFHTDDSDSAPLVTSCSGNDAGKECAWRLKLPSKCSMLTAQPFFLLQKKIGLLLLPSPPLTLPLRRPPPRGLTGVILIPSMGNCPTTFISDDGNSAFLCQILGNFPLTCAFPCRNKAN